MRERNAVLETGVRVSNKTAEISSDAKYCDYGRRAVTVCVQCNGKECVRNISRGLIKRAEIEQDSGGTVLLT